MRSPCSTSTWLYTTRGYSRVDAAKDATRPSCSAFASVRLGVSLACSYRFMNWKPLLRREYWNKEPSMRKLRKLQPSLDARPVLRRLVFSLAICLNRSLLVTFTLSSTDSFQALILTMCAGCVMMVPNEVARKIARCVLGSRQSTYLSRGQITLCSGEYGAVQSSAQQSSATTGEYRNLKQTHWNTKYVHTFLKKHLSSPENTPWYSLFFRNNSSAIMCDSLQLKRLFPATFICLDMVLLVILSRGQLAASWSNREIARQRSARKGCVWMGQVTWLIIECRNIKFSIVR